MKTLYSQLLAVLSLSVLLSAQAAAREPSYTFTTIDYPGAVRTHAYGLNNRGQVVGHFVDSGGGEHTFRTDGEAYTPLPLPGDDIFANDINNRGQIVGQLWDGARAHGYVLAGDTLTTFDVPGATFTTAYGVNGRGQVVGLFGDPAGVHGFLLTPRGPGQ